MTGRSPCLIGDAFVQPIAPGNPGERHASHAERRGRQKAHFVGGIEDDEQEDFDDEGKRWKKRIAERAKRPRKIGLAPPKHKKRNLDATEDA